MFRFSLFLVVILVSVVTQAQDGESQDLQKAYKSAQEMLRNKTERNQEVQKSDSAKKADEFVEATVQGDMQKKEDLYKISADILGNYSSRDPADVSKLLLQASKNPEDFFKSLTPEQRKAIQDLAKSLGASQGVQPEKP